MVVGVMGLLFILNWLSFDYISKAIIDFNESGIVLKVIEAVLRTVILVVLGLVIIYKTKISKEINEIINKIVGTDRVRL